MDLFLLHTLILIWTSIGAARQLTRHVADQLLAAGLLAWGNIVISCLFLSVVHRLGEPLWFLGTSALLALLVWLLLAKVSPAGAIPPASTGASFNPWLLGAFVVTVAPLALASLAIACTYAPDSHDAISRTLPRALFYIGQNSLAHFETADAGLIAAPFNFSLLGLFGLVYNPATQSVNFFNLAAWAFTGIGVYRLCRLCAFGPNLALLTCWVVLTATPVLAHATAMTVDLPITAGLLGALVFFLQWRQSGLLRHALLAGLAAGLVAGSDLSGLLFGCATGLVLLPWARVRWRLLAPDRRATVARPWIAAALLAGAFSAPFALINGVETGRWLDLNLGLPRLEPLGAMLRNIGWAFVPQLTEPPPLQILHEEVVSLGLTGLLFLIAVIFSLFSRNRSSRWFAGLGLGWIAVSCLLPHRPTALLPGLVPALALLSPCIAALLATLPGRRPGLRCAGYAALLSVGLTTVWAGGIYLRRNSNRPLAPLLGASFAPPVPQDLPLLLTHNLSPQTRINIDSDGVDEVLFPLMTVRSGQKFTARKKIDPAAYNLISRATLSRGQGYRDVHRLSSCLLLPIPDKRTAGVQFLATIGTGPAARDYFGVIPEAGDHPPMDSARFILATLSAGPGGERSLRLRVQGLNPGDQARLVVQGQTNDWQPPVPLASVAADGEALISVDKPFVHLLFQVIDANSEKELSSSVVPYLTQGIAAPLPPEHGQTAKDAPLFMEDLVLSRYSTILTSDGLLPTEGPFPKWDLPYIRWARQPVIQLKIPPVPQLARLKLDFSVRLHTRENGALEVRFNGRVVQNYRINGRTTWLDQTLELTPQSGENILEFRNITLRHEPDWPDYLERYPDVKKYLLANNLPLEQGAREHFETFGRAEGRTMLIVDEPAPPPDSYYFMFRNIHLEGFKAP